MENYFKEGLEIIKVAYDEKKIEKSFKYLKLLIDYNSHTNITAIRDEKGIIDKHFLDSLLLNNFLKESDKNLVDLGSGAGFPGMILAIFNPEKNFVLIDSVKKKTDFLELVKKELELKNVEIINDRVENYVLNKREYFDVALCRGVSSLRTILEYEIPLIKVGGRFLPQKMVGTSEVAEASEAMKKLGVNLIKEIELKLPHIYEKRLILEIKKNSKTDLKYPRKNSVIKKNPL